MIPSLGMLALAESRSDYDKMSKLGLVLFLMWFNTLFWTDISEVGGRILARGAGYYAWMASLLIVWVAMFILDRRYSRERASDETNIQPEDALEREDPPMLGGTP
jgi:hypothetical protein